VVALAHAHARKLNSLLVPSSRHHFRGSQNRVNIVQYTIFSYPHTPTSTTASINYSIDTDLFPCATVCFIIHNLPPGSQAAIRDVAEAYRTIPITPCQWPGLVIKLRDEDTFAINTCNNFGQPVESMVNWVTRHLTFFVHLELGQSQSG
jgi:hypothetical protein